MGYSKKFKILISIIFCIAIIFCLNNISFGAIDTSEWDITYNDIEYNFSNFENSSGIDISQFDYYYISFYDKKMVDSNPILIYISNNKPYVEYYSGQNSYSLLLKKCYKFKIEYNSSKQKYILSYYGSCMNNSSYFSLSSSKNGIDNLFSDIFSNTSVTYNNTEYEFLKSTKYPQITTALEDLETLNFDNLSCVTNDYYQDDVYLLVYDRSSENEETLDGLYPYKDILLNTQSKYYQKKISEGNSIFFIPIEQLGVKFEVGKTYEFRFAIREPVENEFTDWVYNYLGDYVQFTISSDTSQEIIASYEQKYDKQKEEEQKQAEKEEEERKRQEQLNAINGTTNAINEQKQQDQEFYNNILSNDYNQNQAGDTLNNTSSATNDIDDSEFTGLFTAIFNKFSNIINGDYSTIEKIEYPIPNTDGKITITSDLLSSKIKGTFIYNFLQIFWYFLFGIYIFKFSNNLIRKIKDGSILNGYENSNEVITSTML